MSFLKKGDKVGIIAPSVGLQNKDINPTLLYFKNMGLIPVLADNLQKEYRYMAGTDEERAKATNNFFSDKSVKALVCLRGGAGSTRMLPYLNYKLIKQNPKPIIGLSDSTALQNALIKKADNPSFTGFLPLYDLNNKHLTDVTDKALKSALFSDKNAITSGKCLIKGSAKGKIIGGCLSVLLYLCGTPYFPDLKDKILLIEDDDEKTYKTDLMLNQLKQQKNFNKLKAVIFGHFTDSHIVDPEDGTIEDCIRDFTKGLNIPVVTDFAYGHIKERYLVPLGIEATLSVAPKKCTLTW